MRPFYLARWPRFLKVSRMVLVVSLILAIVQPPAHAQGKKRPLRTNVDSYPKWQAWMRERQPRLLVIWGKYDPSFDLSAPKAYRRDVPNAEVHIVDAGHFALDTRADEIAALVDQFMKRQK